MRNYTITHLHTMLSNGVTNIDSVTSFQQYIDRAKECGMNAIAFTEHGSVFEWYHKKCAAEEAGMKYIHAAEVYLTESLSEKARDNYHCCMYARNYEGVKELNRLISASFNRNDNHFYYVPRISFDELESTSDNIIITSACIGGALYKGTDSAKKRFLDFCLDNKHRCFLEVQPHIVPVQAEYNAWLLQIHRQYGIKLIAGTDTHALNEAHIKGRSILQKSKNVYFEGEDGWELKFQTYDELCELFKKQKALPEDIYIQAIENTNLLASMIEEFSLDRNTKYPHIYENPEDTFIKMVYGCAKNHPYINKRYSQKQIQRTLDSEIEVYKKTGSIDFMLLQKYLRDWEHEHGVYCGYGRGSVSGSFVAYVLGITQMDSIKFGLNFFRFMNPDRVSNADIDTDYGGEDRDKVKYFLLHDHLNLPQIQSSEIITFNTIALKGAIRDVCRGLYKPQKEPEKLTEFYYDAERAGYTGPGSGGLPKMPKEIQDLADQSNAYLKIADYLCKEVELHEDKVREEYPEVFQYVDIVNGVVVSIGSHPSGVLVTDHNIADEIGLCSTSGSEYPISMLNMKELDALMYVKLDILGLDNIAVINETCRLAGIDRATPDNIPLDDMNVWKSIRDDTTMIFQFESASAQAYIRKLFSDATLKIAKEKNPNFSMIKWLSFGNGLIRPSCASFRNDVADGKSVTNGMKELDDFLSDTMGHIAMQEDIMQFLVKFCGYSAAESDNVRRCVDEDTLITMADSTLKTIKEISVGDMVSTISNDAISRSKVTNVFDNGIVECVKVSTKHSNEVICTRDHKFLTQYGWKKAKDLTKNDFIMVPSRICRQSDGKSSVERLSGTDCCLLGLLIGDGTLGGNSLCFTNSDTDIVEKYKNCVQKRLQNKRKCTFSISETKGKTVDTIYAVRISDPGYNQSVKNLVEKYGLDVKSAQKHIPDEIMAYPAGDKLSNFIAALFSTDGSYISQAHAIEYSSTSKKLILDLKSVLLKYGIYSYLQSKWVSGYNYYSYSLRIKQPAAMTAFKKYILPFMVGYKKCIFEEFINHNVNNPMSYNYRLPYDCVKEIRDNSKRFGVSMRQIGSSQPENTKEFNIHWDQSGVTDVKARKAVSYINAPLTYKLLMADYIPVQVVSVEPAGSHHVYDIEVEDTHNYIANGLIAHNCIAKKYGTEAVLPEIKKRFIEYSMSTFHYDKDLCEKVIDPFLQVILDASSYGFSWNHSDAYSCIGYICGYLRYYYPLEFVAAALNVFSDKEDKTAAIINYAIKNHISLSPAKFGKSRSGYMIDQNSKTIYKGMESIKYLNSASAEYLYSLKDNKYRTFMDLLVDISQNSFVNARQLDVLIKIDFFSEFGNIRELSEIVSLFDLMKNGNAKSISREKVDGTWLQSTIQPFVESHGKNGNPLKSYRIIDMRGLLDAGTVRILSAGLQDVPFKIKIQNQMDYLGYVDLTTNKDEDRRKLFIMDIRPMASKFGTGKGSVWGYAVFTRSLGSGKQSRFTIKTDLYQKIPVVKGQVVYADKVWKNNKGYWYLDEYHVLEN